MWQFPSIDECHRRRRHPLSAPVLFATACEYRLFFFFFFFIFSFFIDALRMCGGRQRLRRRSRIYTRVSISFPSLSTASVSQGADKCRCPIKSFWADYHWPSITKLGCWRIQFSIFFLLPVVRMISRSVYFVLISIEFIIESGIFYESLAKNTIRNCIVPSYLILKQN